jgi:hypothetical protein
MEEVTGRWTKCTMMNFIICTLHIRAITFGGICRLWHVAGMAVMRKEFKILLRNREENSPYVRCRHNIRWEDNIKMCLEEMKCEVWRRGSECSSVLGSFDCLIHETSIAVVQLVI